MHLGNYIVGQGQQLLKYKDDERERRTRDTEVFQSHCVDLAHLVLCH